MPPVEELSFSLTPDGPAPEAAWFTNEHKMRMYVARFAPPQGVAPRCAVVWLHGLDDHSARWAHVAKAMTAAPEIQAVCYFPDWQGHGRSSGVLRPSGQEITGHSIVHYDSVVDDFEVVIRYARKSHPNIPLLLGGHSLGGLICVKTLTQRPEIAKLVTDGLVLSSPALAVHPRDDTWMNWNVVLPLVKNVVAPLFPGLPSPIPLAKELTHDKDFQAEDARDALRGTTPRGWTLVQAALELKKFEEPGVIERIKLPWLVLGSPDDLLVSPTGFDVLEKRSSTPKDLQSLHSFPGAWHELMRETPEIREKVLKIMLEWIAKRVAAAPRSRL